MSPVVWARTWAVRLDEGSTIKRAYKRLSSKTTSVFLLLLPLFIDDMAFLLPLLLLILAHSHLSLLHSLPFHVKTKRAFGTMRGLLHFHYFAHSNRILDCCRIYQSIQLLDVMKLAFSVTIYQTTRLSYSKRSLRDLQLNANCPISPIMHGLAFQAIHIKSPETVQLFLV